jgi:ABC-2 type transport system permease protein
VTSAVLDAPTTARSTGFKRYREVLWLLTARDLRVRYSTSALGYFWSILDPLVMAGIYWFVFTEVFKRDVGEEPYIVFLLAALLPWMWFNGVFSLPVLAVFAILGGANITGWIVLFPLALVLQTILTVGIGLIVAPLVVFFRDLERAVKLTLRFLFYASPIIYSASDLPEGLHVWSALNPLTGLFTLYRAMFFAQELDWFLVAGSAVVSVVLLGIGMLVFARSERAVLKEI